MARAKCWCNVRVTSINNASWVEELNGVAKPFCVRACHERYLQIHADRLEGAMLRADLERREQATRIIGSFDEGFEVVGGNARRAEMRRIEQREPIYDDVGNEVYAR